MDFSFLRFINPLVLNILLKKVIKMNNSIPLLLNMKYNNLALLNKSSKAIFFKYSGESRQIIFYEKIQKNEAIKKENLRF